MSKPKQFVKLFLEVSQRKDLELSDKIALCFIRDRAGTKGECSIGYRKLSELMGISKTGVRKSIIRLQNKREILISETINGRRNHYIIPTKSGQQSGTVISGASGQQSGTVRKTKRSTELHPTGQQSGTLPVNSVDHVQTYQTKNQSGSNNESFLSESFLTFPTIGKTKEWSLTQAKVNEYQQTHPDLDVEAQLRRAWQWIQDNPKRRKTARGMTRFLGSWLNGAADNQKGDVVDDFTGGDQRLGYIPGWPMPKD